MRYVATFFMIVLSLLLNACQTEDGVPTYWGEPENLEWSPDGKTLAVCSTSGIWLFDAAALNATPRYISALCDRMVFSPDSKLIAIPFDAEPPYIGLWSAETQRFIVAFRWIRLPGCPVVYSDIDTVIFSPDSKQIAAAGSCGIEIWDINSGTRTDLLHVNTAYSDALAYSPDGKYLVNTGWVIEVWDVTNKKIYFTAARRGGFITFSPDGKLFASHGSDIVLWGMAQKEQVAVLTTLYDPALRENYSGEIRFVDDGKVLIVTGSRAIVKWDLRTYKYQPGAVFYNYTPKRFYDWLCCSTMNPAGDRVANIGTDPHGIFVWDAKTGKLITRLDKFQPG